MPEHTDYWAHAENRREGNDGAFIHVRGQTVVRGIGDTAEAEEGATAINRLISDRFTGLFAAMGIRSSECKMCKQIIYWVRTKAGKSMPYSVAGVAHFGDCPNYKRKT